MSYSNVNTFNLNTSWESSVNLESNSSIQDKWTIYNEVDYFSEDIKYDGILSEIKLITKARDSVCLDAFNDKNEIMLKNKAELLNNIYFEYNDFLNEKEHNDKIKQLYFVKLCKNNINVELKPKIELLIKSHINNAKYSDYFYYSMSDTYKEAYIDKSELGSESTKENYNLIKSQILKRIQYLVRIGKEDKLDNKTMKISKKHMISFFDKIKFHKYPYGIGVGDDGYFFIDLVCDNNTIFLTFRNEMTFYTRIGKEITFFDKIAYNDFFEKVDNKNYSIFFIKR